MSEIQHKPHVSQCSSHMFCLSVLPLCSAFVFCLCVLPLCSAFVFCLCVLPLCSAFVFYCRLAPWLCRCCWSCVRAGPVGSVVRPIQLSPSSNRFRRARGPTGLVGPVVRRARGPTGPVELEVLPFPSGPSSNRSRLSRCPPARRARGRTGPVELVMLPFPSGPW